MFNANMPYRNLGHSGLKLGAFSLGGWTTFGGTVKDFTSIRSILHLAYESGVNFSISPTSTQKGIRKE